AIGANEKHLIALIRNAPEFPDAYLLLGDLNFLKNTSEGDEIAVRAYYRASQLYAEKSILFVRDRLMRSIDRVQDGTQSREVIPKIRAEIRHAEGWLSSFKRTEASLIKAGRSHDVNDVKLEMMNLGLDEPKYDMLGHVSWLSRGSQVLIWWIVAPIWILVAVIAVIKIRERRQQLQVEPAARSSALAT
ncbi:MAG: hypothetical protein AAF585_21805, partial [Verrucomicrobiota bacterium]